MHNYFFVLFLNNFWPHKEIDSLRQQNRYQFHKGDFFEYFLFQICPLPETPTPVTISPTTQGTISRAICIQIDDLIAYPFLVMYHDSIEIIQNIKLHFDILVRFLSDLNMMVRFLYATCGIIEPFLKCCCISYILTETRGPWATSLTWENQ